MTYNIQLNGFETKRGFPNGCSPNKNLELLGQIEFRDTGNISA